MANQKKQGDNTERDSKRIIDRVERESETLGTSSLARTANKARDHFMGEDQNPDDPIEVWGTRIGRTLSLIAVVLLAGYLYNTYFK